MKTKSFGYIKAFISIIFFVATLLLIVSNPLVTKAESGTLGTGSPQMYFTYTRDGETYDGNSLKAGTYDVDLILSGFDNFAVFQTTLSYDESVVTVDETASTSLADSMTDVGKMPSNPGNGNIVLGLVSSNSASTALSGETVMATYSVTFASDCDAADYITVSTNPNHTFVLADYNDGWNNVYALVDSFDGYNGTLTLMGCDVTPEFGHTVTGLITTATDYFGNTYNKAAYGEYTIDVYSDEQKTLLVDTFKSVYSEQNGEKTNQFELKLNKGTYYAVVSYDYALAREDITIVVGDADISGAIIPVIACDFDSNKMMDINDIAMIQLASGAVDSAPWYDLNADGKISIDDTAIATACSSSELSLEQVIIQ